MRRAFEELQSTLAEYVEQDAHTLLVLTGADSEFGFALKALEALDAASDRDLYFVHPLPFQGASEWVTQVASIVAAQIDATNEHRAEDGQPPLPPFPLAASIDVRVAPEARLRAVVDYLLGLLPDAREHRLVFGLAPVSIADAPGYARLVGSLAALRGPEPSLAPLRVVARDPSPDGQLVRALEGRGLEVLSEAIHFSPAALMHWLTVDAADPELEASERMSALLQLAVLDTAARRYEAALEKLRTLVPYFACEGLAAMHAISLLTVGDILRAVRPRSSSLRTALERYQQAIAVAMKAELWPLVRNGALSAGQAALELGAHADAQSYFDSAAQISEGYFDAAGVIESRMHQGDAALAGERYGEALTAWHAARDAATKASDPLRAIPVLERLVSLHRDARQERLRQEAEAQLRDARHRASASPSCAHTH